MTTEGRGRRGDCDLLRREEREKEDPKKNFLRYMLGETRFQTGREKSSNLGPVCGKKERGKVFVFPKGREEK